LIKYAKNILEKPSVPYVLGRRSVSGYQPKRYIIAPETDQMSLKYVGKLLCGKLKILVEQKVLYNNTCSS
jgi:hypothetical protein